MNYQEMSDKDISRAVGNILNIDWANLGKHLSPLYFWKNGELDIFDPCESWADAGPIIRDNFIDLESIYRFTDKSEENIEPTGSWCARGIISGQVNPRCEDANPLRAAMIVFLMMKGGE